MNWLVKPTNRLRTLNAAQKELDSFDSLFDSLLRFNGKSLLNGIPSPDFSPSLDVIEKDDSFIASIELSGMSKDDVEINLNDDSLIISGEKRQESTEEKDNVIVSERSYGRFKRELLLPEHVDTDSISAKCENGVLTILLPKKKLEPEKVIKKIDIQS